MHYRSRGKRRAAADWTGLLEGQVLSLSLSLLSGKIGSGGASSVVDARNGIKVTLSV